MSKEQKPEEHGPELCAYCNLPGPQQTPFISCLCGWESSNGNRLWEDVGREFDEHLKAEAR